MSKEYKNGKSDISHIDNFIFDLDNTLYSRECELFTQIDILITQYVMNVTKLDAKQARKLQKDYYRDFGTTMNGLMVNFGIDPDDYLKNVHNIDYSIVGRDKKLANIIKSLPGKKYIFTNADIVHAETVLERLGFDDLFDGIFDIRKSDFTPKPHISAYEKFISEFEIEANQAIMFDDLEKNLQVPAQFGMQTVHVVPKDDFRHSQVENWELSRADEQEHVHHITSDLANFLEEFLT